MVFGIQAGRVIVAKLTDKIGTSFVIVSQGF